MLENHIQLNRSFNKIDVDNISDNSQEYDGSWRFGYAKTKWSDLLENQRVIILAEAGAGKTEEIMAITHQIRESGQYAFFFRLEHLHDDFELAFEIGDFDEFNNWKESKNEACFFLDSVDEARLGSPHQYERAIKKFAKYLGNEKQRARVYITSRSSEWRPKTDFAFFKAHLPFLNVKIEENNESDYNDIGFGGELTNDKGISADKITSVQDPLVYSLAPLDDTQIKIYAEELGVNDTESFLTAINKAEAKDFTTRPLDLEELIEYWGENKRIANRRELIEFTISRRLIELDTERDQARPLNKTDAVKGVELIASATTFQKIFRISVPDGHLGKRTETSLPIEDILVDWDSKKIGALLARPIFDKETYGAVRFYHRSIREFLTARWLYSLLTNRLSRQKIEKLFFQERYGCISVVPSLRPILSWLITFDEEICEKTLKIAPELLIQGGDPSALPTSVKRIMLKDMCQQYVDKPSSLGFYSFDIGELRRFTHPDLNEEISSLLRKYSENSDICELLLRMIWQGELQGCRGIALEFAKDSSRNIYTQLNGLRAIEVVGTVAQKQELIDSLFLKPETIKERVASEIISAYAPNILTVSQILQLVEQVDEPEMYSHSELQSVLEVFVQEQCSIEQCYEWALGLAKLLERPPSKDSFDAISKKYEWLLLYGAIAIERLIVANDSRFFEEFSLAIISFCEAVSLHHVSKLEKQTLDEMIPDNSKLSKMLFWYDVRKHRAIGRQERLTDFWHANGWGSYWKFTPEDIEWAIDQIKEQEFIDDKLVALSLAFKLYVDDGRNSSVRYQLKKIVKGNNELEESLARKLKPPSMDEESRRYMRQSRGWDQKRKRQEIKQKKNKEKWIKSLKKDYKYLLDTSIAEKGQVWDSQAWLCREIDRDGGSLAVTNWQGLTPVFGESVAKAFRDGAIDYWRKHTPKLKSEVNNNSIYSSTTFGLSGIGMEYELYGDSFLKSLSADEATLTTKYALQELNGFPRWFYDLFFKFSPEVKEVLLGEIEWEISEYKGEMPAHHVLDDVNYHAKWARKHIAGDVLTLLSNNKPFHVDTVRKALTLILSSECFSSSGFVSIAKNKIINTVISIPEQAIWFAGWVSISANEGVNELEIVIKNLSVKDDKTELMMGFITSLMGRDRTILEGRGDGYRKPNILSKLIKLAFQYIRVEDDIDRSGGGGYSPTIRDDAQNCRGNLVSMLVDINGKQTYLELKNLEKYFSNSWMEQRCANLARQRAANDSEFEPWGASDVITFGESLEKNPQNNRELYDLSISKLVDIKYDLEQGDSSEAKTWKKVKEETELRVMIGNRLRLLSNGFYSVPQEEELADKKKPDFRIHHSAIDAPVPIELKIVDNGWTVNKLKERIKNQLIGQYLRDQRSICGIFLLVYRGEKTYWEHPDTKKRLNFSDLLADLRIYSDQLSMEKISVEAIEVIGIDLTLRMKNLHEGYFELFGSWEGDALQRPEQGDFEQRKEFK